MIALEPIMEIIMRISQLELNFIPKTFLSMLSPTESETNILQSIISECKGQPFSICLEKYFLLKESNSNLKDVLALILISFPREIDSLDCLYNELFCTDTSKNLVSLYLKNTKGLLYLFNNQDHDLVSLLIVFIQKILKLSEKTDKPFIHQRILRITASLLFFFPIENKIPECQILIQKILEQYNPKKRRLDLQCIELLALLSFGLQVYTDLLAEKAEGQMEEESYVNKIVNQFKEDNKDYEMIMEGLMLKLINSNEEKLTELYEIICRIINIRDVEGIGQEIVCEKFTRKVLVLKTNRLMGTTLISSLKDKIASDGQKEYPSFWRDNLLLEVLRTSKDTVNAIAGGTHYQIYLDFMLNIKQPYRDYEYKILQRILSFDFGSSKKEDYLILKKMHQIILSEDFFKHVHMNLFLIYYTLRMADLYKKNNVDKDFQNIYFSKILRIPIPIYIRQFEKISKGELFSGREARTLKRFQEELDLLLLKYFEFLYLPFSKLKLDSFKFQDKQIESLIGDSYINYEKNFEKALQECLNVLQRPKKEMKGSGLEKAWHMLFQCDPVKVSQATFHHFLKESKTSGASQSLVTGSFLDPLAFALLNKELFRDLETLKILLQSLSTQLSVWEMFTKDTAKGNIKKYMTLLKNAIVHYMIEIIAFLSKRTASSTVSFSENITVMCEYIHIVCVEDVELIEGIIKEGFSFDMVKCLADGVEWMHACLFFADSLLNTKNNQKKVFYILLLSYIIQKYPTMTNYGLAKRLLEYDLKILIDCSQMYLVEYIKESLDVLTSTFADLQAYKKDIQKFYSTYTLY